MTIKLETEKAETFFPIVTLIILFFKYFIINF